MPPPIVPAPTTAARAIVAGGRVLRHVGNLGGLPLGEEQVAQRLRLGRHDAVGEQLALAPRAGVERHGAAHASMASTAANGARAPRRGLAERGAHGLAGGDARGAIADPVVRDRGCARRSARRGTRFRERDGAGQQLAVDHGVDDARLPGARGAGPACRRCTSRARAPRRTSAAAAACRRRRE